jgi:hypothetical protein
MEAILTIDSDLVTNSIKALVMSTLTTHQNGSGMKWQDAELAIYLVYILGDINKCSSLSVSHLATLLIDKVDSWSEGTCGIRPSSGSTTGKSEGRRLLRLSSNRPRRDAHGPLPIAHLGFSSQGSGYAILRDCGTIQRFLQGSKGVHQTNIGSHGGYPVCRISHQISVQRFKRHLFA